MVSFVHWVSSRLSVATSDLGEDLPRAQQTVMLSYKIWQLRFAASKKALGRTITLDGVPSLVIGVLPPDYHSRRLLLRTTGRPFIGVSKPAMGPPSMASRVSRTEFRLRKPTPISTRSHIRSPAPIPVSNRDRSATVIPLVDAIVGDIRPTLVALMIGAGLLSLVGFVNISSLLLVRAESRRRETAVRTALGATRGRLCRQFAVEGFLLASAGCALVFFLPGAP